MPKTTIEETFALIQNLRVSLLPRFVLFHNNAVSFPKILAVIVYIWSQLQIFLIISKATIIGLDDKTGDLIQVIQQLHRTLYVENLLSFEKSWRSDLTILILITLFLMLIVIMIGHLLVLFMINKTPSSFQANLLSFVLRMHPFVWFYPVHLIGLQILSYSNQQKKNLIESQTIDEQIIFGLGIAIVIVNTLCSVSVLTLLEVNTRTKGLFSTKTIIPNVIELAYKFSVPFLWAFTENDNLFSKVILIVSLVYCLIKAWILFRYLPYYKLSILRLDTIAQALIIALAAAAIIASITSYYRALNEFLLFTLLWIVLSLCFGFLYRRLLGYLCFRIVLNPSTITNSYYIIHFFSIYKSISKSAVLGLSAPKMRKSYLDYISIIKQSEVRYLLPSESESGWTVERQSLIHRHFFQKNLELLENFMQKKPDANLVRITLAHYYAKREDSFVLATHILDGKSRSAYGVGHSKLILKLTILQKLKAKENHPISSLDVNKYSESGNINVQHYLEVQETYKHLKVKVLDQVATQITFWKDFQGQNPDFFSLKVLALQVYKKAYPIKKISNKIRLFIRAGYSEPLLILGLYFCFIQNDVFLGQKFMSEYYSLEARNKQKNLKGKAHKSSELALEFPYLVISTSQNYLGRIIDCYGKIKPCLGFQREAIVGKSINTLMPPLYAKYHDIFIRESFQNPNASVLNKATEVALLRPDKYLILCRLYLGLRYLTEHGLCFSAVIRLVRDKRRLVIITQNGIISNLSEDFEKDMRIRNSKESSLNIFDLCPGLEKVLQDFNTTKNYTLREPILRRKSIREDSEFILSQSKISINEFPMKEIKQPESPKSKLDIAENRENRESRESQYTIQIKEANLTFYPQQSLTRGNTGSTSKSGKQTTITYETEIKKISIQNIQIFELKMKKMNNVNASPLLTTQRSNPDYILHSVRNGFMNNSVRSTFYQPRSPTILKALDTIQSQKWPQKPPLQLNLFYTEDCITKTTEDNLLLNSPIEIKENKNTSLISIPSITESINEASINRSESYKPLAVQIPAKSLGELEPEIYQESDRPKEESFRISDSSESSEYEKKTMTRIMPGVYEALTEGNRSQHSGLSIENFKGIETQRLFREVIESNKPSKKTRYYHYSFVLTLGCLLVYLVWLNIYTSLTSKDIGNLGEVLSDTSFRNYWTNIANQETRIWVGKRTLYTSSSINATIDSNNKSYQKVNEFNQNLRVSLGDMEDDILHHFNARDISVFERNSNKTLEFISKDDSFQLTNKIVNNGLNNVNKPKPDVVIGTANNPQTQFIFDNSCNDLLITSESLIDNLQDSIFDLLQNSRQNINITLVITLTVLVIFLIISFCFVIKMNREYKDFMEVLFALPLTEVKNTEIFLSKFTELIDRESNRSQLLKLSRTVIKQDKHDSNDRLRVKSMRKITHTASMKNIYRRAFLTFLGLFCALLCIVGFIIIYYTYAVSKLSIMRKQHVSINTALKYINTLALTNIGTQALAMDINPTIRNIPVVTSLGTDLEVLRNINTLQESLKDNDGKLSSKQQEIFSNISCSKAYSPLYSLTYEVSVKTCVTSSKGLNRTGLTNALIDITGSLTQFIYDYQAAAKDENTTKKFFTRFYTTLLTPINLGLTLLLLSYTSANNDFIDLVKELEESRVLLAWIATLVTVILGSITWFFVIRRLLRKELEKRKMLSLVPTRLILENLRFKKYIDALAINSGYQNLNLSKH